MSYITHHRFWKRVASARPSLWLLPVLLAVPMPKLGFEAGARTSLRALWHESVATGREHVACIGGHPTPMALEIDRVMPLAVEADSLSADAALSIEACGPPEWIGTVHTHPHNSPLFKETFSPSDRAVFAKWRERWGAGGAEGTFCVLYSDELAHCMVGTGEFDVEYAEDDQPLAAR